MKTYKAITSFTCAAMLAATPLVLHAEMVGTSAMLAFEQRSPQTGHVFPETASASPAERAELRNQLEALGVSPALAAERVASMTDTQLQQLSLGLKDIPAGGGALGVVATVLVIILLLEILGITNLSNKI